MYKKYLKMASILMMVIFIISTALAGCGTEKEQSGVSTETSLSQATANANEAAKNEYDQKIDLTWLNTGDYSAYKPDTTVEKTLEEKFNVNLTTMAINSWEDEKINVTFASGEIPDVFIHADGPKYYTSGIIREIPQELINKYMPWHLEKINELDGDYAWYISKDNETKTKIVMIPAVAKFGSIRNGMGLRQDWMDNLGVAKLPETLDELHDVLLKFRTGDPDKNGKQDTYALGGLGAGLDFQFQNVFGAFGVMPRIFVEENGKITWSAVSNGYKKALKVLNQWYKEGIIDPEFATEKRANYFAKLVDGKLGVFEGHAEYYALNSSTNPPGLLYQKDPKATFTIIPAVKGPDGTSGAFSWGSVYGWGVMFGKNTSDEKMIRAMQMIETIDSDIELYKLVNFGIEGTNYTVEGKQCIPKPGLVATDYGIQQYNFGFRPTWDQEELAYSEQQLKIGQESMKDNWVYDVVNFSMANEKLIKDTNYKYQDMTALEDEFYFNAITGKIDIDSEWDGYVKKWMDLGGSLKISEAQNCPKIIRK
jgi:hypothetical protein